MSRLTSIGAMTLSLILFVAERMLFRALACAIYCTGHQVLHRQPVVQVCTIKQIYSALNLDGTTFVNSENLGHKTQKYFINRRVDLAPIAGFELGEVRQNVALLLVEYDLLFRNSRARFASCLFFVGANTTVFSLFVGYVWSVQSKMPTTPICSLLRFSLHTGCGSESRKYR